MMMSSIGFFGDQAASAEAEKPSIAAIATIPSKAVFSLFAVVFIVEFSVGGLSVGDLDSFGFVTANANA